MYKKAAIPPFPAPPRRESPKNIFFELINMLVS